MPKRKVTGSSGTRAPPKQSSGDILGATTWVLTGTLSVTRAEMGARLEALGATVAKSFTKAVTHVLAGDDEIAKGSSKVVKARDSGIPLVRESFVEACEAEGKFVDLDGEHIHGAEKSAAKKPRVEKAPKAAKATKATKAAKATKATKATKKSKAVLDGTTWVLTGTLSESRAKMSLRLEALGAAVAKSFTKAVTHVLAGDDEIEKESSKVVKARDSGIPLVRESFVEACEAEGKFVDLEGEHIHGDDADDDDADDDDDDDDGAGADDDDGDDGGEAAMETSMTASLDGTTWAITGTLSEARTKMAARIEALGGKVAKSFTKAVTHVLAGEDEIEKESSKVLKARDSGIPLVKEAFLLARESGKPAALSGKFVFGDGDDDEDEEDEGEGGGDGDGDSDGDGEEIDWPETSKNWPTEDWEFLFEDFSSKKYWRWGREVLRHDKTIQKIWHSNDTYNDDGDDIIKSCEQADCVDDDTVMTEVLIDSLKYNTCVRSVELFQPNCDGWDKFGEAIKLSTSLESFQGSDSDDSVGDSLKFSTSMRSYKRMSGDGDDGYVGVQDFLEIMEALELGAAPMTEIGVQPECSEEDMKKCMLAFASMLKVNSTLKTAEFRDMSNEHLELISDALKWNSTVETINIITWCNDDEEDKGPRPAKLDPRISFEDDED